MHDILEDADIDATDVLLVERSDIDRAGRYDPSWLLCTADELRVVRLGEPPILRLRMADVQAFRCDGRVGSGTVQALVDGLWVDVIRYSNRRAFRFERAVERLERLRRGEPMEQHDLAVADPLRCPECELMLGSADETCPRCVDRGAVLLRMLRMLGPYRRQAVAMMALLAIGIGLDLVSPQLTRYLVDEVLPGSTEQLARIRADPSLFEHLTWVLVGVVGILAVVQTLRMGVNILNGLLSSSVGSKLTFDIRSRLVEHLEQLSVDYYDRQQVGSLVGRVAYDTDAVHGLLGQLTGGFILQLLMVIAVLIMMITIDPMLAMLALLPSPLIMGATVFFWRRVYPRYYRFWDAASRQAGALTGLLRGIRVLKVFGQEQRELERFNGVSGKLRDFRNSVDGAISTFNGGVGVLFQLGGWFVWFVGGREVLAGRLTLGDLMAFFGYMWMFYGPLAALPQMAGWLTQFATQTHRIFEVLDTPVAIREPAEPVSIEPFVGDVAFERVSFAYERHSPVLRDVDFRLRPGEMVGMVGPSGSGKTTIVNLLCRFYDPTEGRITFDGVDARRIGKADLREKIAVVLQETVLFRGSIGDNIAYGRPDAEPSRILEVAKAAQCHEFVLRHPHAYDTWLGENGSGLSGGERQRLGIARALLADPRILILDEATSNVDPEGEAAIQAALARLVEGRTTLAIAHRLSTLRRADRIIALDGGAIVEEGSHESLMEKDGVYARLVRLQGIKEERIDVDLPAHCYEVRWLDPDRTEILPGPHRTMRVRLDGRPIEGAVFAIRCFPVQWPRCWLSLRSVDAQGRTEEIGVIRDLGDWPIHAQELVDDQLAGRYLVHVIERIRDVRLTGDYLELQVHTHLGRMDFTVRRRPDRVQDYGQHGKLLLDEDKNQYLIPDLRRLSPRERTIFSRYVDW